MEKSVTKERSKEEQLTIQEKPFAKISEIARKLNGRFNAIDKHFVERDTELQQIKYAMMIKEHVLLKGKTGTAKSRIGKFAFGHIENAKLFAIQMSKFMSDEYLFGAIDINKMRNEGKIEHVTDDSVVDCEFAFIDEVFDGNDALLRSLLEVLNERTFTRHSQRIEAKLHSAILTSNYVREDEVTEAFLDRIIFKSDVKPIVSNKARMSMYKNYIALGNDGMEKLKKQMGKDAMKFEELASLAEYILSDTVVIPEEVLKFYDMVLREYAKQLNFYISDRRANKMLNIIKASAVLDGREMANSSDVENIRLSLVTTGNAQQEEVFRAVYTKLYSDNVNYVKATEEIEKLEVLFGTLSGISSKKMNPKTKEILELNEETQLFQQTLSQHSYNGGSGYTDVDSRYSALVQGTEKIIREVAKVLKLSGK